MKKNRNTFFQESSYQSYNPMMGPNQYQTAGNYFYEGPMPNNYITPTNDIESRLSKIERQINRLDYRLSKLENVNSAITSEDFDSPNKNNMYML